MRSSGRSTSRSVSEMNQTAPTWRGVGVGWVGGVGVGEGYQAEPQLLQKGYETGVEATGGRPMASTATLAEGACTAAGGREGSQAAHGARRRHLRGSWVPHQQNDDDEGGAANLQPTLPGWGG
jgi:hypothetical protein